MRFPEDPAIERVVGVARRLPRFAPPKTEWVQADITSSPLVPILDGADAVIHLAWAIQPSRDDDALRATNVDGSLRVFDAVSKARVPALVYASSVGAYSPGPKDREVDESWPTDGIETSFYSRHKAEVESILDDFERGEPGVRVVRLRPGLIFKREAATEIRRLFLGPLVPRFAFSKRVLIAVPDIPRLRFQAVHTDDVAEAYRLAASTRRPVAPTTSPPTPFSTHRSSRTRSAPGASRFLLACSADLRPRLGAPGFSRRLRAGSTWGLAFRS